MKIAYLHYLYGPQTGLHHVRQFAAAARQLGYDLDVHAMHPYEANAVGEGAGDGQTASFAARARARLKRHLGRYLHDPKEFLLSFSYMRREMALLERERPDVLLVRSSVLNCSCGLVAPRLGLPLVVELNAPPFEAVLYEKEYWHSERFTEGVEGWKLRRADHVVVVSSWTKDHLVEHFGLPEEGITVAPNGADVDVFHPDVTPDRELPRGFAEAPVVGFVGSFHNWHGPEILGRMALEVAQAVPGARFLFVGEGPEAETVKRTTATLGERVLYTGRVPHERVPHLVASFDVAVLPDSHHYGSPLKVLEWMGAGKAVVAPRYDPLAEVIDDGVHGILFPPKDSNALAAAVIDLIRDPRRRTELGRAAAERARTSLTWQDNARRVLAACEKVSSTRRRSRERR